ncbi:hypothetical protein D8674_003419 [Pyrus ussuriensis x Pyrus communis]|uniref:RNase H type-1 domain-containing protein n=1 Tax=Pyrus ussuriensis x Pyrus communis TaxID=2448454 RepID=A0A5N5FVW6_9ROSA|nr:hypothetical protein D8674_003419 [Pyrus ussuriensis x Pyrus communis]
MKVQQKWRRPGVDWVKCNFDGAWIQQGSRGGFGAVLRDHMGDFVAAVAGPLGWTGSAFHAELCATRQALLLAQSYCPDGKRISFEDDSSLVMAAMKGKEDDCSPLGNIINDLRFMLQSFPSSKVSLVQRGCNSAAHRLIRLGLGSTHQIGWCENPPNLLRDILFEESL